MRKVLFMAALSIVSLTASAALAQRDLADRIPAYEEDQQAPPAKTASVTMPQTPTSAPAAFSSGNPCVSAHPVLPQGYLKPALFPAFQVHPGQDWGCSIYATYQACSVRSGADGVCRNVTNIRYYSLTAEDLGFTAPGKATAAAKQYAAVNAGPGLDQQIRAAQYNATSSPSATDRRHTGQMTCEPTRAGGQTCFYDGPSAGEKVTDAAIGIGAMVARGQVLKSLGCRGDYYDRRCYY